MRRIVRNNTVIEFDRIVAYGCSFTAGSETLDHELFCHVGGVEEVDNLKRQFTDYASFSNKALEICKGYLPEKWSIDKSIVRWDQYYEDQKKMSYANKLADRFGVPCLNRAVSGSSTEYAGYQIDVDLANNITKPSDLILVGITSPGRKFYLDDLDEHKHLLPGYPSFNWKSKEFHDEYVSVFTSKSTVAWSYYRDVSFIEYLNTRHDNILCVPMFEVDQFFSDNYYYMPSRDTENGKNLCNALVQAQNFKTVVKHGFRKVIDVFDRNLMHGFNHPSIKHHEAYADSLYELLK